MAASAGNGALRPMMSDQFDITFERYMGRSSSFTLAGFYKKLSNTIAYGLTTRAISTANAFHWETGT